MKSYFHGMSAEHSKINGVQQKDADTKQERLLLGFLSQQATEMGYGELTLRFTVRNGRVDMIRSEREMRTFNVGQRD